MELIPQFYICIYIYIIIMNGFGFISMFTDKRKAILHQWRYRENSLLLIAVLGGSIGILLGMIIFHHKTNKPKFKIGIPLIICIQFLMLCYSDALFSF